MIHDGDYYSIADKDKIISLLDEIEQKIILLVRFQYGCEKDMNSNKITVVTV